MKTIKIICLFAFLFAAFSSCTNEDGEVCYDPNDFGHQEQTALDPSQTDTENDKGPQN
ncbi:MAG: hypothetical protein AB3N14_15755 [Flavobacteriaceae bacterium]